MATQVKASPAPRRYDDANLNAMTEPITVRVERQKGGQRTPIYIPENEDGSPGGTGWTKDDVRRVEERILLYWGGGGAYDVAVTDSSEPPKTMKWSPFWSLSEYPELPAARGPDSPMPAPPPPPVTYYQPPAPPQPQVRMPPPYPSPYHYQQPYAQQQPYAAPYNQLPPPPPVGTNAWPQWQAESDRRKMEDELRVMRERAQANERDAIEARHTAALRDQAAKDEAMRATQERALGELRAQVAQLTATLQQQHAQAKEDPKVAQLEAQLREQRERMERETLRAEARASEERRDREHREAVKAAAENTQRQIDALTALVKDSAANRTDPMITLLVEQTRQQAEAIKEVSRTAAAQLDRVHQNQLNPMQLLDLLRQTSTGVDAATDKLSRAFSGVFEFQQKAMENILNMQPGSGGALDLVGRGLDSVKELAERYMGGKAAEARTAAQAQAEIAKANSRAVVAQTQVQMAAMQPPPPQTATTTAGLAGATVTPIDSARRKPKAGASVAMMITNEQRARLRKLGHSDEDIARMTPQEAQAIIGPTTSGKRRLGRTDAEWFGPILTEVEQLREGVARFMESCAMDPPRVNAKDQLDGVSPPMVIGAVFSALQVLAQQQIAVPVMLDLLLQQRFADFADVLIPDASQPFRDEVVQGIAAQFKESIAAAGASEPADADDADDDDDDDADAADADDAASGKEDDEAS